jgi:2-polyprenyl-3-methyl-5-hydroxy-6-metoxy-1,4-benzoquinol methylase
MMELCLMARQQRHKYEYKASPRTAAAKVVRMVGSGKRVLELGSGPGSITRLLKDNDCRITALEVDEKAIKLVTQYCESVYSCDLNNPDWPTVLSELEKFEVVVAGDVLEHLYDPWATLNRLKGLLMEGGGYLVISLPHTGHNAVIACLLNSDFSYQPWGLLDKTHIRFFAIKNIQRLFNESGFKIVEVDFVVKAPEQTEFAGFWRRLPTETQEALANNKFGAVYQVVIKAVPDTAPVKGLKLASLTIPAPSADSFSIGARGNRALGYLLSFLSLRSREIISRMLEFIGFRH